MICPCLSFQPTLPARGATGNYSISAQEQSFQPTLPARGATITNSKRWTHHAISTHAPRTGSDVFPVPLAPVIKIFQPTLPARGATPDNQQWQAVVQYFNPRSPHGERQSPRFSKNKTGRISTHAPRTGSDAPAPDNTQAQFEFQPTLPARGATINRSFLSVLQVDFNPRSPHGERLPNFSSIWSTIGISTHAPRTGSDIVLLYSRQRKQHFNPRSPHGERLVRLFDFVIHIRQFQPTLPARGATGR